MAKKLPTDREILKCIYELYLADYPGPADAGGRRANDPYLPIKLEEVAGKLGCDPELLFGRLYYHLNVKHGYKEDGASVSLFSAMVGGKRHCVHFPLLAAVLAGFEQDFRRQAMTFVFSLLAFIISLASLIINLATRK